MRGVISTTETNADVLVQRARSIRKMDGTDLARVVSTKVQLRVRALPTRAAKWEIRFFPTALVQKVKQRESARGGL